MTEKRIKPPWCDACLTDKPARKVKGRWLCAICYSIEHPATDRK